MEREVKNLPGQVSREPEKRGARYLVETLDPSKITFRSR